MKDGTKIIILGLVFSIFAIPHFIFVITHQNYMTCSDTDAKCIAVKGISDVGNFMWIDDLVILAIFPAGIIMNIREKKKGVYNANERIITI